MTIPPKPRHLTEWCFKVVNVSDVPAITKEILDICNDQFPNMVDTPVMALPEREKNRFGEILLRESPLYRDLLERLGIIDRLNKPFILVYNRHNNVRLPMHVDHTDWRERSYALNIPVLNCENSYTAFYDAPVDFTNGTHTNYSPAIDVDPNIAETAPEINSIPHRPVVEHDQPRVVLTSRFTPELFDYSIDDLLLR